jgi:hypothetical protein
VIPIAVTLLWFPLIGIALSRLIGRVPPFLGGVAGSGATLFLTTLLGAPLRWSIAATGAAAVIVIVATKRAWEPPWKRTGADVWLVLVPVAVLLFAVTFFPQHDYDGTAFWMLKAKAIATEGAVDGPFFRGESTFSPRNEYPLLLPLNVAAVMKMSGQIEDASVRWIFPLILASFALELRRRFRQWFTPATAALTAGLLVWTPQFAIQRQGGAMSSYADVAFAALIAMAFFELVEATSPARFGFWSACAALTKSEGLPIAALFLAIGLFVFRKRIVTAVAPVVVTAAALVLWRSRLEQTDEGDLFGRLVTLLPSQIENLLPAAAGFARYAFVWGEWGIWWVLVAVATVILIVRRQWRPLALAGALMGGMLVLYSAVYVVSEFDRAELLRVTAARLLMHFAGPALFIVASAAVARNVDEPALDAGAE